MSLDGWAKRIVTEVVNARTIDVQQSTVVQSNSGPVKVMAVNTSSTGEVTLTVKTEDGRTLTGISPGTSPVGAGSNAILLDGKRLR